MATSSPLPVPWQNFLMILLSGKDDMYSDFHYQSLRNALDELQRHKISALRWIDEKGLSDKLDVEGPIDARDEKFFYLCRCYVIAEMLESGKVMNKIMDRLLSHVAARDKDDLATFLDNPLYIRCVWQSTTTGSLLRTLFMDLRLIKTNGSIDNLDLSLQVNQLFAKEYASWAAAVAKFPKAHSRIYNGHFDENAFQFACLYHHHENNLCKSTRTDFDLRFGLNPDQRITREEKLKLTSWHRDDEITMP